MRFPKLESRLVYYVYRALCCGVRFEYHGLEHFEHAREGHPRGSVIFALWHQSFYGSTFALRDLGLSPMISASKDGELITQVALRLGYSPVRGSSSRGGKEAREQLYRFLEQDQAFPTITVDGPRGPLYKVKSGVVDLARYSGAKILPFAMDATRAWDVEKSWDRCILPKPFSTVHVVFGPSLDVPKDCHGLEFAAKKREVAEALHLVREQARSYARDA